MALLKDGTRVYSPITTSTYADSTDIASFEAPANIKNLWFVVSVTPTGICMPTTDRAPEAPACVYSVTGTLLRQGTTSLEGLPHVVYIVNGRKVIK